jgi:hypothetical protein
MVASGAAIDSAAHSAGNSHLYLQIYPDSLSGRFEIALSDLNPALGLSGTELEITADNLDQRIGFLQTYFLEHVSISADRGPLSIDFKAHGLLDTEGGYVLMPFDLGGFDQVPEELIIEYSVLFDEDPDHRGFLLVEHNWATGTFANEGRVSLVFDPDSRRQVFDLTSSGRLRGFMALVHLGAEHMVFGLDHVFFLVALLLPVALRRDEGAWQPLDTARPVLWNVVVIVTAFAAAHAVALLLAALGLLRSSKRSSPPRRPLRRSTSSSRCSAGGSGGSSSASACFTVWVSRAVCRPWVFSTNISACRCSHSISGSSWDSF